MVLSKGLEAKKTNENFYISGTGKQSEMFYMQMTW